MARKLLLATAASLAASALTSGASALHGPIFVHAALGGQIQSYDIDQNGAEGVLTEFLVQNNGHTEIAIETFNQKTGKVKIIRKQVSGNDYIVLNVVSTSIGLVEEQHADPYVYKTSYDLLNPLDGNTITGHWAPKLSKIDNHIQRVSENQGFSTTAVLGVNFKTFESFVLGADVAANTSGPITRLTDDVFGDSNYPVIALDTTTNRAVVAAAGSGFYVTPELAVVDLVNGGFTEFAGVGNGEVNGIAVDSADGIACTTTLNDWSIEFYDLATETGVSKTLNGATGEYEAGYDVEFDSVNKLFLIDQEYCASQGGGCIDVYDTSGNFVEAVSAPGFGHIAFNPNTRTGFLELNDGTFNELESFSY
jgi:hypothetical protein